MRRSKNTFDEGLENILSLFRTMTVIYFLPNKNFSSMLPSFLSTPDLLVGMPVSLANLDLAAVMPKALFHEKEKPKFLAMGWVLFKLNRIQINGCEYISKYN